MEKSLKAGRMQLLSLLTCCLISISCRGQRSGTVANSKAGETAIINIPTHPLNSERDLDVLLNEIGDARVVMLGEATHGTAEFYTWRAAISRRLIQEKGFDFIAVEGEWADSYRINNFIKGQKRDSLGALALLGQFNRWPTWMWGNYEIASLVTWLNAYNQRLDSANKVGYFGLDVYCLWESMAELMPYLQGRDASLMKMAMRVNTCFQPYGADAEQYARAVSNSSRDCRRETSRLWNGIRKLASGMNLKDEALFVMEQNALVALNAERYYRAMVSTRESSWNIRDRHMMETLRRLLQLHGPNSKAIVWEHNTHVGDARFTDMAQAGEFNIGQLARQELGESQVFIVGTGIHRGTVTAADRWGDPYKTMTMPEARAGSWEEMLHAKTKGGNCLVLSRELKANNQLEEAIGHRAVGVVYRPRYETGNYVPSLIPRRYDAFMFIDRTNALRPIPIPLKANEPPDLYPSGS